MLSCIFPSPPPNPSTLGSARGLHGLYHKPRREASRTTCSNCFLFGVSFLGCPCFGFPVHRQESRLALWITPALRIQKPGGCGKQGQPLLLAVDFQSSPGEKEGCKMRERERVYLFLKGPPGGFPFGFLLTPQKRATNSEKGHSSLEVWNSLLRRTG